MSGSGSLSLALGALPESDFCGKGRIKVVRKGRYHPVYALSFNGQPISELTWEGPRRLRYTVVETRQRVFLGAVHAVVGHLCMGPQWQKTMCRHRPV